jgi:hypothetical protein
MLPNEEGIYMDLPVTFAKTGRELVARIRKICVNVLRGDIFIMCRMIFT